MEKHDVVKTVEEILEIRVIKDLITKIKEDSDDRRTYRREHLARLDDIILYLKALSEQDRNSK